MAVLRITYKHDPRTSKADYDGFYKVIISYRSRRVSNWDWTINTKEPPQAVWQKLKRCIDPNDYLLMLPLKEPSTLSPQITQLLSGYFHNHRLAAETNRAPSKVRLFDTMMKGGRTGWDLAQEWLIKDAWKSSCRAPCRNVSALRQARAHNYLPPVSIPHSAVVCTLPGMRCKAGLKSDESLKSTATRASSQHHCNVEKCDHQRLQNRIKCISQYFI
jgi:hypothetical protein